MSSPLDSTFGFWLISIWLQTLLQGCGLLQAWLYFHWYSKDHWGIKTMVMALVVIETFQIVVFFQITYFYFIDGFGDLPGLFLIHWQDSAQLFATYLSAFIVQMYFGYCIYILDKKNIINVSIIVTLALTQLGAGFAQTIITVKLRSFTQLNTTKVTSIVQAVATLLCDLTITALLVRKLGKHKGPIRSTNSMLNKLMINAVNRGALTAFLALPGTFYFFIGLLMSGKLYMNSALATLNSRQYITTVSQSSSRERESNSVQMDGMMSTHTARSTDDNRHVRVIVSKQSETDSDYNKQRTFVDGML